jgi:hypothetical protein
MATLLQERPQAPISGADQDRCRAVAALVERLERWLPAEEKRLSAVRRRNSVDDQAEAEWKSLLRLYERLCAAAY